MSYRPGPSVARFRAVALLAMIAGLTVFFIEPSADTFAVLLVCVIASALALLDIGRNPADWDWRFRPKKTAKRAFETAKKHVSPRIASVGEPLYSKFCRKCGKRLHENAKFCPSCGLVVGRRLSPKPQ